MNDVTNLKAPGWQRVVAELSSGAPDDRAFLDRLLRILAQVSASRQAVLYVPSAGANSQTEARPLAMWPAPPSGQDATNNLDGLDPDAKIEFADECRRAAFAALESGQSRVFGLESKSQLYDAAGSSGYVLAVALPGDGQGIPGVVSLLIEARSKPAVQSTLAMAEVIAGYVHTHALRQELKRLQAGGRALDLATRLIGAINNAEGFKGACLQLANDLAKLLRADRVAIGWCKADTIQVLAISDTEHFDKRMTMVRKLQSAMDECLDQEQAVMHPPPTGEQDVLLSQAISHAHRELAGGDVSLRLASVPLRFGESVIGVITIEARNKDETTLNIDPASVELIQATMDLVSPVLSVRRSDDRALPLRAVDSALKAGTWLVGTRHTVWKLAGIAVLAAMLFVTFYTTTYRVGAYGELLAREKRIIGVPFDGVLRSRPAGIEAGAVVNAGDLLAEMDTTELVLQAEDVKGKLAGAQKAMDAAMKDQKTADAKKAEAQVEQARAQLDLLQSRIARSRITAPISGTIISGDLRERIGSSMKLGEELFQIAPLNQMMAVAKVDERDIALITPGSPGQIATRSNPGIRFPVTVEQVVPLAQGSEGKNIFEVRVRLDQTAGWMRPGMEGVIRLDTGERSLLYIGTRRILESIRLWVW